MKILVTGAAGFIGSHLVEALLKNGHQVIGLDNFNDYYAPAIKRHTGAALQKRGCEVIECDLVDDDLQPYLADVEVIYHTAAQPGISSKSTFEVYLRNNILATQRLVAAAEKTPSLRLLVNVSSSSVYGGLATVAEEAAPQPISYYGITKLTAEQLIMAKFYERGLPATSLRLYSVYGARERPDKLYPRLIHSIVDGVPFPVFANSWDHRRSFTFVGDVVQAFLQALVCPACVGEIINIGTTEAISTGQAIRTVEQLMGKPANYVEKPPRTGDQQQTEAVITKAAQLLGYHPTTPFVKGIQSEIEWFEALPPELRAYYSTSL